MWQLAAGLLAGLTLVLAGPVTAEERLTAGTEAEEIPLARVVTGKPLPHECLAPVIIDQIDGENRALPSQGFAIPAGKHRLNGNALLDTTACRPLEIDAYIPPAGDLSMDFEAGHIYYVAYDRSHPDATEWRLVVWKIEREATLETGEQPAAEPDSVQ